MVRNPKVSVIIPVYNAEKFLEETLVCLKKQTLRELEVILVDDGSVDKSKEICNRFVASDSVFKYYYQNNSGASAARNHGIRKASGEYICFMDADDLCEETWMESLYNVISNSSARIAMLGWKVIDENNNVIDVIQHKDCLLDVEDAVPILTSLGGSVWNKVFERNLIVSDMKTDGILFDEKQKYSEDILFCIEALCKAKKIQISSKCGYIYRNRNGSMSHQTGMRQVVRYEDMLCGQEKMVKLIEKNIPTGISDAHRFYCSSNFYAMLDLYMTGIRDKCIYKKYATTILNDKYSTIKLRIMARIILILPGAIFIPWIVLRKSKRILKKAIYVMGKVNE